MDGKNTLGIVGILVGLVGSIASSYISEKHPAFFILALLFAFITAMYIAYETGKNPEKRDYFSMICLGLILLFLCGFSYYALNKSASQSISSNEDRTGENYEQETLNAESAINDYHQFINNRNCAAAYELLTTRYRKVNEENVGKIDKFEKTCRDVSGLAVSNIRAPSKNVRRFVTLVSWKQNGKTMKEDTLWGLEKIGGKWLIDTKLKVVE